MTSAPAGIATSPRPPTTWNLPAWITMTEFSIGGRPVPSINLPPCTTSTFSTMFSFPPCSRSAECYEIGLPSSRHDATVCSYPLPRGFSITFPEFRKRGTHAAVVCQIPEARRITELRPSDLVDYSTRQLQPCVEPFDRVKKRFALPLILLCNSAEFDKGRQKTQRRCPGSTCSFVV